MNAAVRASGVTKRYGETVALDEVSVTVTSGEVFALVGPNGAGKTTLVQTLTGTKVPTEGDISVLGQSPNAVDPAAIGLLPQSFSPQDRLTVRELFDAYAGLYDATLPVESVLEDVGITEKAQARYETLSGGQKRRVCVGIALINDPDLLFLDEPTTGIDPAGRQALWKLLESLSADGTTVLLTTHDMAEAAALADKVALLNEGEIIERGSPGSLVEDYGGAPALQVETAQSVSAASLSTPVGEMESTPGGLRIAGVEPAEIGTVIDALGSAGVSVERVAWSEPTLEDAYLHLTNTEYTPTGSTGAEDNR